MTPKKRREKRAAQRAAQSSKPLPSAVPSQRSTFRVAQAQRQLAAELPSVVRNRQAERRAKQPRFVGMDPDPDQVSATSEGQAKRSPSRVMQTRAAQPTLDGPNPDLKCRPKSNKPAAGGGSGRRFVPWGKC